MKLATILAPLALALPAAAQLDVRPAVTLQSSSDGTAPFVTTDGDLSVAILKQQFFNDLSLVRSDGLGLEWSSQVGIDPANDLAPIQYEQAVIDGDDVVVLWADGRFQFPFGPSAISRVPFVRIFDTVGQTFGPEIQVPMQSTLADVESKGMQLAVTEVGGARRILVASIQGEPIGPSSGLTRIAVHASGDDGATWQQTFAQPLPNPAYADLRMFAEGSDVHVFWSAPEQVQGFEVFHARSTDGGATFGPAVAVPGARFDQLYDVDVQGAVLAMAWAVIDPQTQTIQVERTSSTDGGQTWAPVTKLPQATGVAFDTALSPEVEIRPQTAEITLAALALQNGAQKVVAQHSPDAGVTWQPTQLIELGSAVDLDLEFAGDGRLRGVLTWQTAPGADLRTALTLDGGQSFGPAQAVDAGLLDVHTTWNDRYQNLIYTRAADDAFKATAVTGFRPQDLDLIGFSAGSTAVQVDFANMDGGANLAFVFLSSATGNLPLPLDGRNTGLGDSPLLQSTLPLALNGVLASPLFGGAGSTGSIPMPNGVPAGLTVYALGLSLDTSNGTFVDLTDVLRIDT